MRVLLLAPGEWIHSKRTIKCLLDSGHQVVLMDYVNPFPHGGNGFYFIRFPRTGRPLYRWLLGARWSRWLSDCIAIIQLKFIARHVKPDVVHVCWVNNRAFLCAKANIGSLVLSVWGSDINKYFQDPPETTDKERVRDALLAAEVVIVESPAMQSRCEALAGRHITTRFLHLGVDTTQFHPSNSEHSLLLRSNWNIPQHAVVFVSMRALAPRYNHHLILRAFALAVPKMKVPAILVFKDYNSNEVPSYRDELISEAERLNVSQLIRWIHNIPFEQLHEVYALADYIISFPTTDAFPVTFLEAAACERPVIAGKLEPYVGTFAEKSFAMVEPENIVALAETMVHETELACRDIANQAQRLRETRELVESGFSETHYTKGLEQIYMGLHGHPWNRHKNVGVDSIQT